MRIGVLAAGDTPADVAASLAAAGRAGFECAQLHVRKPVEDAGWAAVLASAREHALPPVAMGGYVNPLDPTLRREDVLDQLAIFMRRAAAAGIPVVVTWSGTRAASMLGGHPATHGPAAWEDALSFFRAAAPAAEAAGVTLAIEPYYLNVASSPERLRDLIDQVGSPCVKAVMDPPNFVDAATLSTLNDRLPAMFETLSGRIALVHAKDARLPQPHEPRAKTGGVTLPPAGQGVMDYATFAALLRRHYGGDVIVEHVTPDTMDAALAHVRQHLAEADDAAQDAARPAPADGVRG